MEEEEVYVNFESVVTTGENRFPLPKSVFLRLYPL